MTRNVLITNNALPRWIATEVFWRMNSIDLSSCVMSAIHRDCPRTRPTRSPHGWNLRQLWYPRVSVSSSLLPLIQRVCCLPERETRPTCSSRWHPRPSSDHVTRKPESIHPVVCHYQCRVNVFHTTLMFVTWLTLHIARRWLGCRTRDDQKREDRPQWPSTATGLKPLPHVKWNWNQTETQFQVEVDQMILKQLWDSFKLF